MRRIAMRYKLLTRGLGRCGFSITIASARSGERPGP